MADPKNIIKGTPDSEILEGTPDNDRIISYGGEDTLYGLEGDDQLNGYPSSKGYIHWNSEESLQIFGGQGDDFIVGGSDRDQLFGGDGDDVIHGRDENDDLFGGSGNDKLFGLDGDDKLDGGIGDDELWGGASDDELLGGLGKDYLDGGLGDDLLDGGDGDDELYGDVADGDIFGNDTLIGGTGADYLSGDGGNDSLYGNAGNDILFGGTGDDILDGGAGFDKLYGGAGNDQYIINSATFYLLDSSGQDSATVNLDFLKIPSTIETINYSTGIRPLPYWISALLFDDAASYTNLLGLEKTFYYGFPKSVEDYSYSLDDKETKGWQPFSSEQQNDTRKIFEYIQSIIDVNFVETENFNRKNTIAFGNNQQESGAFAVAPGSLPNSSDVFIGILDDGSFQIPTRDGFQYANVFIHEIGHALGLKHPFDDPSPSGKVATPPYLVGNENNAVWTQMSYSGSKKSYEFSALDISALQYVYGVASIANAGDTIYVYDEKRSNFIWDGSGNDTIDASGSSEPVTIFLEPGLHGFKGLTKIYKPITSPGQITVNFGTEVENLIGSSFSDLLTGNNFDNILTGGRGSDLIDGMMGIDTAVYEFDRGSAVITFSKYDDVWNVISESDIDSLKNIERLKFNDVNVALDLDGNAGKTVKLLSALLGSEGASNPYYIGAGLNALDSGMTYESLMKLGLEFVLGSEPSSAAVISLFYENLVGSNAPESILSEYKALLDEGSLTPSYLGIAVAEHSLNAVSINLVGLKETGVEYI